LASQLLANKTRPAVFKVNPINQAALHRLIAVRHNRMLPLHHSNKINSLKMAKFRFLPSSI